MNLELPQARVFGTHESNYSRMLSGQKSRRVSRILLNRAIKRRLDNLTYWSGTHHSDNELAPDSQRERFW